MTLFSYQGPENPSSDSKGIKGNRNAGRIEAKIHMKRA
jgi:hypothetical protein